MYGPHHLKDEAAYERLSRDTTLEVQKKVEKFVATWKDKGVLPAKLADWLVVPEPKPGAFYVLPKVYQRCRPAAKSLPLKMQTRPVAAMNSHPVARVAQWLDSLYKLLLNTEHIPEYV